VDITGQVFVREQLHGSTGAHVWIVVVLGITASVGVFTFYR
jgi:hypothetical protein